MTPRVTLLVGWAADDDALRRTLLSVLRQDAADWEVVVPRQVVFPQAAAEPLGPKAVDTPAPEDEPGPPEEPALPDDPRIRYLDVAATGAGPQDVPAVNLEAGRAAATGELLGVLAAGDELEPGALTAALMLLDGDPGLDVVYTDEQWPGQGAEGIATKPDWLPHYLQSYPYLGRLCLIRSTVAEQAGGFRLGFAGEEEWDLALRVTELTTRIAHLPVVAVSRPHPPAQDPLTIRSGLAAVQGRVDRSGRPGYVEASPVPRGVRLWWHVDEPPLVTIMVPTAGGRREVRGQQTLLVENCLRSVAERTGYDQYEVVLVGGDELDELVPRLDDLFAGGVRQTRVEGAFNFSTSVNEAARVAEGDLLLLLNDDTEVRERRWLERMVSVCQGPGVGAVGARLVFGDETVQHVGVSFGDDGHPTHPLIFEQADTGRFGTKVLDVDHLAVTGACLLTPAEVFREVGGLCVELPSNYNDVDYCLKVAATGRAVVMAGLAELYHFESSSRDSVERPGEFEFVDRHWGLRRVLDPHVQYRKDL